MYCVVLFDTGGQDLRLNFTKLETEKSYDYLYIDAHYINETNFVPRFEYSGNYTPFEVTVLVNLPTDDPSLGSDLLIALAFVSDGSVLSGGVDFSWMFGSFPTGTYAAIIYFSYRKCKIYVGRGDERKGEKG
jgi:hypothetical protein